MVRGGTVIPCEQYDGKTSLMFCVGSLTPNEGSVDLLATAWTALYRQKLLRIKVTPITSVMLIANLLYNKLCNLFTLKYTCENAVFFSNVALLAIRASIISFPFAPCLHKMYRITFHN